MSKKVKNLITGELTAKFKSVQTVAVISPRGIDGIKNNGLRRRLREKGLRMTVVKNSLVRRAVSGTELAGFDKLLDGPSALIHGSASIAAMARLLIEEKKKDEKLQIHGLFFDGEIYQGEKGIELASKLPTREEAIASLIGLILSPGRKLAGAIKGPGGRLGAVLKTIEEKAKDKQPAAAEATPPAGAV
jgi:large subunit ribosomal protein L10